MADKFADEMFENNRPDPFHQRMANIRSYRDLREYFGLGSGQCNETTLKEGFMSQKLHACLEQKLGKEKLDSYFGDGTPPKLSKEDQEIEDLAVLLGGSVREKNRIQVVRLKR